MKQISGVCSPRIFLLLMVFTLLANCTTTKMPETECGKAEDAFREFYSQHFAGDMSFNAETLKQSRKFLTPELNKTLGAELERRERAAAADSSDNYDPFTGTAIFPNAFRVGRCRIVDTGKSVVEASLLWRNNNIEQSEANAFLIKQNENWLIDDIIIKKKNQPDASLKDILKQNSNK